MRDNFEVFKATFWVFIAGLYCFDFQIADMNTLAVFAALILADLAMGRIYKD